MKKYRFEISAYKRVIVEAENADDAREKFIMEDLAEKFDTQEWYVSEGKEVNDNNL